MSPRHWLGTVLVLLIWVGLAASDEYVWTPSSTTTCVNCSVQVSLPSLANTINSKGLDASKLATCGIGNVILTIEYPQGMYYRKLNVQQTLNWTNAGNVACSINGTNLISFNATPGTSSIVLKLPSAALALMAAANSTLLLSNLNSPVLSSTYISLGSISAAANNISAGCLTNNNGLTQVTLIDRAAMKIGQNLTNLLLNVTSITPLNNVIGTWTNVTMTMVATGVIPPMSTFQLLSINERTHFLEAFSNLSSVTLLLKDQPPVALFSNGSQAFTLGDKGTFFVIPESVTIPQNTPFSLVFGNVFNPTATTGALEGIEFIIYYGDTQIQSNTIGRTASSAKYYTVIQGKFTSSQNSYDLLSAIFFGICLVISLYIVYKHGLAFTSSTVWTDLVSISVVLSFVCSFSAYFLWLFRPSYVFVFLTAGQYLFQIIMIVSLCFHWASVLRLQLFRKLSLKSPVVFVYIGINAILLGGLLGCLIVFSTKLDCVYTDNKTGALRYSDLENINSPPPANGYQVLDSLAMCKMNGYYVLLALGFMVFTLFLVILGGAVMCRGRSLMLSEAQPLDDRMMMRKSLTIFYCIIASAVVIFVISDIIYIASYIISKPIEYAYQDTGTVPDASSNNQRVSTSVWYLFTIWLPQIVPPLLLLLLHYDPKREDDADEIAVLSAPKDTYVAHASIDTPESEAVGDLNVFKSHRNRRYVERAGTFLEDASNKLHVIVKLKVPEGALPAMCYISLEYCTLPQTSKQQQNNRQVLLHTLTKDAVWKSVAETERITTDEYHSDVEQFRSSTLGMSNVPFVAVLSIPVLGLAPNTLLRFILHASQGQKSDDSHVINIDAEEYDPLMEFVTTPQAIMDAASHGQALVVNVADDNDITCPALLPGNPRKTLQNTRYLDTKLFHDAKLNVTTVSMGESSTGEEEKSHQNMGNIIRYFQYEAEVGDGGLVVEELKESRYSNSIPRQFLDLIAVERADDVEIASNDLQSFLALKKPTKDGGFYNQILQTIQDEGDATVVREWLEDRLQRRKDYLSQLRKNIQFLLQRDNQKRYFKASVEKKSEDLKFVPINLHVEDYLVGPTNAFVNEEKRKSSKKVAIYEFTTVGAMAAHCYKFKNGGISSMINKLFKLQQKKNEHDANNEATRWNDEGRAIDDLKWDVKLRMDVCFSQALTALVASFVRKIELAFQSPDSTKGELILNQLSRIGFLFQVESLLSTHGNEIGMLEDMSAAIERLSTVAFCIQDVRDKPFGRFSFRRRLTIKDLHNSSSDSVHEDVVVKVQIAEKPKSPSNSHIKYVVTVHVNCNETLLPSRLMDGGEISVTPLLFTQGINEMQSIANGTERAKTELQDVINMRNILPLQDYCNQYIKFSQSWAIQRMKRKSSEVDRTQMLSDEEVKRQLETIQIAIEEAANSIVKTKRPDILTKSSDLCRSLGGGRVTICKSAKDRTAMSVTLEQVRILHRFHGLPEYKVASTVAVMRTHGVRIENALKNTGKRQFAFNKLQRYAMPEDYRCPESTGGTGNIS